MHTSFSEEVCEEGSIFFMLILKNVTVYLQTELMILFHVVSE